MSPCRSAAAMALFTALVARPEAIAVVSMAMCALRQFQPAFGQIYTHRRCLTDRHSGVDRSRIYQSAPTQSGTAGGRSNPAQRKTAPIRHSGRPLHLSLVCASGTTMQPHKCIHSSQQAIRTPQHHSQADDLWPMIRERLLLVAELLEDGADVARSNC